MLWKAQLYQESQLNPNAKSGVGAAGLAQFMPGTWRQITKAMNLGDVSRYEAVPSIEAGAYYMGKLRLQWSAPRPMMDRHDLAAASYNAGLGSLLKAQRRCGGPSAYKDIVSCLPCITGKQNAAQTTTYVDRIHRWWGMMRL